LDGQKIILTEISDSFEIGSKLFQQPDQLNVAPGLTLEQTAGAEAVEVAIDVELEEVGGMVGGAAER